MVATITQQADLELLANGAQLELPDVLEFRLDNLSGHLDKTEETIRSVPANVCRLITTRTPEEGGIGDLSDSRRYEIYRQFPELADLVDIEVSTLQKAEFSSFIEEIGCPVVASFHDFAGFPGKARLEKTVDQAYELGADIAKVAVVVETFADLNSLVELVESRRSAGKAISAMGMGPLGKLSRLVLAKAGSCLNYGYFQAENAPGQWPATELSEFIRKL